MLATPQGCHICILLPCVVAFYPSLINFCSFLSLQKYYDGGMTDNLPVFEDGRMIFVSPFCGRQHICPLDKTGRGLYVTHQNQDFQVNVANLIRGYHALAPPKKDQMSLYYKHGFKDAERFLKNEGFHEPKKNVERIVIYETTL